MPSAFWTYSSRWNSWAAAAWERMKPISTGSRGKIYWHSEFGDNDEKLPDDIDDKKHI